MDYCFRILFIIFSLAAAGSNPIRLTGWSGVPAMHAAVLHDGTVVFLDKIENRSQLYLPDGRRAYSSIYNPRTTRVNPLSVRTNPFCCGGAFLADGRLATFGGNGMLEEDASIGDGFDAIRYLNSSNTKTGWFEPGNKLASKR